jgi:hypothetical protein
MITVLCGGVGAARFLRALRSVIDPATVTGIVNTGDDTVLHGLSISPDIDTITYTLAGAIDPERGWGLVDESWRAMGALARYAAVRPDGSSAAPTWFNLGDQDLATHFYRTARLDEGAGLTAVTAEIARAWGVPEQLVPMSDDRVSTLVHLADYFGIDYRPCLEATAASPDAFEGAMRVYQGEGESGRARLVQAELQRLGYLPEPPDGVWGRNSTRALSAFQADQRLPVNGRHTGVIYALLTAETGAQP